MIESICVGEIVNLYARLHKAANQNLDSDQVDQMAQTRAEVMNDTFSESCWYLAQEEWQDAHQYNWEAQLVHVAKHSSCTSFELHNP